MPDTKVVIFTNLDSNLRQVVESKAHPGMNVITASSDLEDDDKIELAINSSKT